MRIREATSDDTSGLQELQERCPQGRSLIVSVVNTPDFFGRARAYESYKVYVASDGHTLTGSAACGLRTGRVNGAPRKIGYEFQYFTAPEYRGTGVARQLHERIEDHFVTNGVVLSYLFIMEGNRPAVRLFERQGFRLHRTLVMPLLVVHEEMPSNSWDRVRPLESSDLKAVSELLNETWEPFDLYEPMSADSLSRFIDRTPAYRFDNVLVLEHQGEILACLGFWDWSRIARITVKSINLRMHLTRIVLSLVRYVRPVPRLPRVGDTLRQMVLTPIAFKDPAFLKTLFVHLNNRALKAGIGQMFCICERDSLLLDCMKGFIRLDTYMHLYIKALEPDLSIGEHPVFIDGIDL